MSLRIRDGRGLRHSLNTDSNASRRIMCPRSRGGSPMGVPLNKQLFVWMLLLISTGKTSREEQLAL